MSDVGNAFERYAAELDERRIRAAALREEAERLEPYWTIDQKNRRHERQRYVHADKTRKVLLARASDIERGEA